MDHPWTVAHPEWSVRLDEGQDRHVGDHFLTRSGIPIAHGRDPNFPPWTDTAQVNLASPAVREG